MKYKHIVFDIDGTLIDTEYAVLHSLQETIRALSGREIPCSELKFALCRILHDGGGHNRLVLFQHIFQRGLGRFCFGFMDRSRLAL